jgi:ADP-heptose:LPS heptosyltransferase
VGFKSYIDRIKKPADIIKQPWQDFERLLSRGVYWGLRRICRPRPYPEHVSSVLLIRRNRLGDAVNLLPLIAALHQRYPGLQIHVMANPYNCAIFEYAEGLAGLHVMDEDWRFKKLSWRFHPTIRALREKNLDLVIAMGGYSSALAQLSLWIGGKFNVGVGSAKGGIFDLVYDRPLPYGSPPGDCHVNDMAHLVRAAGLELPPVLPPTQIRRPAAAQAGYLAICPDVERKQSRYPLEYYAEIIETLIARQAVSKVLLFLRNGNNPYRALEKSGAVWQPTRDVPSFIEAVSQCQCVLTAEGGSAHVTGALGQGVVVLSGMGHQSYWRPYARHVRVLEIKDNVAAIKPADVIEAILAMQASLAAAPAE